MWTIWTDSAPKSEDKKEEKNITGQNKRQIGNTFEQKAAEYLVRQGFRILEQNFYSRYGEIDLIAKDGRYLVFVEVKYRKDDSCGSPQEAVTVRKQKRICRTAVYYCSRYGHGDTTPCRFDVVAIEGENQILHIRNAFDFQV